MFDVERLGICEHAILPILIVIYIFEYLVHTAPISYQHVLS